MKNAVKKILPESVLVFWRFFMKKRRYIKRYLYARGKDFSKNIKINEVDFNIIINPVKNCCVDDSIAANGFWETEISEVIDKYLPENGVFVDIGANIGYHSLYAASLWKRSTRVFSFEPQPSLRLMLNESIKINNFNNINLFPVALSDNFGNLELSIPEENVGASSLLKNDLYKGSIRESISVDVETLDSYEEKMPRIDLVKIDVEGFELNVLRGAKNVLNKFKPVLIIEFSPRIYSYSSENISFEIPAFLNEMGYRMETLAGEEFNAAEWLKKDDNLNSGQIDIICVPK